MKQDKIEILKVIVGSQAHELADENSDYDYRAVYVLPTSKILSLGYKYKGNDWIEGETDNTSYEIGHFLQLAFKCNPTILEVFKAPIVESTPDGLALRELFPYVWNSKGVFEAFTGYSLNQRKKFLDKKDNRQNKYATAYIRTLFNLCQLLETNNFDVHIPKSSIRDILLRFKKGDYKIGEVIDEAEFWILQAKKLLAKYNHESNIETVNNFLLQLRRNYW
jgi:predicted nucleotidyltransferase